MPLSIVPWKKLRPILRTTHSLRVVCTGLLLTGMASVAQAPLDVRVALVIGNAAYQKVPPLSNSVNDARAMSLVLRKLGFKVFDVIDGDRASMAQAISRLQNDLKGQQAVAMLYYAGHGLQLDWRNYMVPIDANIDKAEDVPKQTVDIEQVIQTFKESKTRMNIIVLDACRDNPFAGSASGKGLAQLDAPPGTYLAFATAPGNVAEDGDEATGNGLFTHFLLKELQRPAKIEDVFKRVRLQVRQKSQGRQIPWDSSSLEDDFAFNDGRKFKFTAEDYQREIQQAKAREERLRREAEAAAERERQLAQLREQERLRLAEAQRIAEQKARERAEAQARERERELALAAEAERKKAQAAQEALARAQAEEAQRLKDLALARAQAEEEEQRQRLSAEAAREQQFAQEKAEWDRIKDSKNAQDFYAFLLKYPNGLISVQASAAIERLQVAQIKPQADRSGLVQAINPERFRVGDSYHYVRRDNLTGREMSRFTRTITKIENGLVYISNDGNEEINTIDGAKILVVSAVTSFRYDPPKMEIPTDGLVVGKKWTGAYVETDLKTQRKYLREDKFKILQQEIVEVIAGKFNTFKIEDVSFNQTGTRASLVYWVDPDWGLPVRTDREVINARANIRISETVQLISRARGR